MTTKPIYQSKTIQSLLPVIILLLAKYCNIYIAEEEAMIIWESIAVISTSLGVIIGRYRANKKLTMK